MAVDPRAALEALIAERREDYAGLSRMLGRNPAYIQQYVKRGSPRRLAEEDRRALAAYFRVSEEALGGPPAAPRPVPAAAPREALRAAAIIAVPRRALGASAGPGSLEEERGAPAEALPFAAPLLRELGVGDPAGLSVIRVTGDSMLPALADGDDILVDTNDAAERLRDGVYVLRNEDALMVKRLALRPDGGLAVLSDNPAHQSWPDADRSRIRIVGRVLWAGGRVR
ncbi:S24 family peptidase [Sphingomonas sp. BIUV-7]|uniref:S24 family peptidase n=1 Tax=Sphingomonas natans TaxID=3063330 RepID=A0ABT8YDD7_9SPHN|nr:S24 family peptidase [Sphingomonas sp. BIUV-7]MDO6416357.1 S24 family peptidase [Sphingomonas sp. BIUV-7]